MSNENHNNIGGWRSKLEDLDSLTGETLSDKNASWENLHARLGGKKHSKKITWYRVAAACILFALMIPIFFNSNKIHQLSKDEVRQKRSEIKKFSTPMIDKKDSININNSLLFEKNTATVVDESYKTVNRIISQKQINKLRLYDTVSMQNLVTETLNNSIRIVDTIAYLAATIPVKKKLPVVHINELGDPVNVPEEVARNSDKHSFLFLKLATQEVYSSPSTSITKDFATINLKAPSN